ncbi:MAG: radical SAM protein [Methanobacteriaceae archaeon]
MGCSFDCSYCYINGSKYANSTQSCTVKSNAYKLIYLQLKNKAKNGERAILLMGSSTDPYMEIEKELYLTRDILKLANRFKFPVHILTKSDLIYRDIDILKKIQESAILPEDTIGKLNSGVMVSFSFSTTNNKIANLFEPLAPSPNKRLKSIKRLKKEGFIVGASLMPLLPYITDSEEELDKTFLDFKKNGVEYVIYGGLSLFGGKITNKINKNNRNTDSRTNYYNILKEYFPEELDKTKLLFKRDYPPARYQKDLSNKVRKIAKKYDIKTSII